MRRISIYLFCLFLGGIFGMNNLAQAASQKQYAIFAGGCFWCMQPPFDKLPGVISTTAGYIGGSEPAPTYEQVASGLTQYVEAIKVVYSPSQLTYKDLLAVFWRNIDPTVKNRQFCDVGTQYRSAIFYATPEQKRQALQSRQALIKSGRFPNVFTEIIQAGTFYPAEDYHQEYYKKNPVRYKFYRYRCGRDERLERLWGKSPNPT